MRAKQLSTPWGIADYVKDIGNGILRVATPSHGGYYVPGPMRLKMPPAALMTFCGVPGWYEEDCDWAIVALCFPDLFPAEAIPEARAMLAEFGSPEVKRALL